MLQWMNPSTYFRTSDIILMTLLAAAAKMFQLSVDIKKKIEDNVMVDCLSMGMSGDYEDAIAAGSTMIRVGTAIFGARYYAKDSSK